MQNSLLFFQGPKSLIHTLAQDSLHYVNSVVYVCICFNNICEQMVRLSKSLLFLFILVTWFSHIFQSPLSQVGTYDWVLVLFNCCHFQASPHPPFHAKHPEQSFSVVSCTGSVWGCQGPGRWLSHPKGGYWILELWHGTEHHPALSPHWKYWVRKKPALHQNASKFDYYLLLHNKPSQNTVV